MADEMNEGTTYLRALKQATGVPSGAAAAPAREPDRLIDNLSTAQGSESFQGAEKRRSPRYKCEGSAQLREEGCDVRTLVHLHRYQPKWVLCRGAGHISSRNAAAHETGSQWHPRGDQGQSAHLVSLPGNGHLFRRNVGRERVPPETVACKPFPSRRDHGTSTGPIESLPAIRRPEAAVRALIEFFEIHQILMRDDFLKLLKKTQQ
jgi:hypothetical protein